MLNIYDRSHTINHQDDDSRFAQDIDDVSLIRTVASDSPKPVFVTADTAMKRKPLERAALADSGLTIVFFRGGWAELDVHTHAWKMVRIWPDIVKAVTRCSEPTAFEIAPQARKVDRLCRTADLAAGPAGRRKRHPK